MQQRFLCGAEPDILKTDFSFSQISSLLEYNDVSFSSWLTTFRTNIQIRFTNYTITTIQNKDKVNISIQNLN
jgi:hypothetical protein